MIRHATPEDARRIAEIQVAAWRSAYRGILPDEFLDQLNVEERENVWRGACGRAESALWVRMMDAEVAGFCHVTPSRDEDGQGVVEVTSIYLDPEQRRRGLGRELMGVALTFAVERGYGGISLWVLVENLAARQFYEAIGFRPDGCLKQEEGSGVCFNEMRYVWKVGGDLKANELLPAHQDLLNARRCRGASGESSLHDWDEVNGGIGMNHFLHTQI